jgi:hypothetical protein
MVQLQRCVLDCTKAKAMCLDAKIRKTHVKRKEKNEDGLTAANPLRVVSWELRAIVDG